MKRTDMFFLKKILHPFMQPSKERLLEFPTVLSCVDYPYQKEIEIKWGILKKSR